MTGSTLSHYQILEKVGEGGMGVVYKARDLRLDRFVCIKILHPEQMKDESRKQRFIQEAKSASSLNHPNIVTIHEIDQADGTDFMVMEFIAGKTLGQMIPSGVSVADVLKYAIPIARALAAASAAGIIHRDVKPGNIMVGANGVVKVLDFGLAKLTSQEVTETLVRKGHTQEGTIVGTAAYMSPEQAQGKPVDGRSDIFSFGAVLYEMISGRRAFQGANQMSTLAAILEKEPASLAERDSRIPRELERLVMRCLRKDPERRFQHMADLRVALEELKEESDSGKLTASQSVPMARRPNWLVPIVSAAFVLLLAAGGWLWWPSKLATSHPPTRITHNGSSLSPAISPDGKLLAYQATIGGTSPQIWVQQIGGNAIQVTHEKVGASYPAFSPDGTQIVYESHASVFEVPALGGDARLITEEGSRPAYVASGAAILFRRSLPGSAYHDSFFTIPRLGGAPVEIQPGFAVYEFALSPDGNKLLAYGARKSSAEQQLRDLKRWWLIPISGAGKPEDVEPPPRLPGEQYAPLPMAWTKPDKSSAQQWVIFGRQIRDTYCLFRVAVTSDGKVTSSPEQLTFTAASGEPSVSENGRMVFDSGEVSTNLWSIPIDPNRAQITGDSQSVTQVEGMRNTAPSLSRDGTKVAFFSQGNGGADLLVKDLVTGKETQPARGEAPLTVGGWSPTISPDGSLVIYPVYVKLARGVLPAGEGKEVSLYSISTSGGSPRLVCRKCGDPKGLSSDGSHLLVQNGAAGSFTWIDVVDVATGKATKVLSDPQHNLWHPYYSWDDKWITFKMETGVSRDRIYITPVEHFIPAGPDRWIQLTSGDYNDDKPQLSPDGNTLYFTSNRDGFMCIWALRLDPKTKHALGATFAVRHFHGSEARHSGFSLMMELNIAKDKIVTNLDEIHSDIWMMDLEPQR